jgi:5'-methylthioadenosine phosphorylase
MLAIIGGSGLQGIEGLTNTRHVRVDSPFGSPSDAILTGELQGHPVAFLPRHGPGHRIPPTDVNFRANIDALKRVGAKRVLSVSAVGSLREHLRPGTFVIVDQFVDRTLARSKSFFGPGVVAHVSMARPVCAGLNDAIQTAAQELDIPHVRGGTYLAMEGPQFSSLAESEIYRSLKCDVIGMTNMPEAKLAREAELCYSTVAMVTDYDCWHPQHDEVTVSMVVETLLQNAMRARSLILGIAPRAAADGPCPHGCTTALEHAIITAPEHRDPELVARLDAVAGRVLRSRGTS